MDRANVAKLFNERASHFIERGYRGRDLYLALAADPELPLIFILEDTCEIERIEPATMRKRRSRGGGPPFKKNGRFLQTTRPEYCLYLADRLVA